METRKVQTVGSGTFTVSLPKEWATAQDVAAGTVVNVDTTIDGVLRIEARDPPAGALERATVGIGDAEPTRLERTVRAAYAAGVEELRLVADGEVTDGQRRVLRGVTRSLVGVTVEEGVDGRATVRTLLDADEVSIVQSLRQLRLVALAMHREATGALIDGTAAGGVPDRDDDADRLFGLIDRHFGRGLSKLDECDALGLTRPELFELWLAARELERVADRAERVAGAAEDVAGAVPDDAVPDVRLLARTARGIVADGVDAVTGDAPPAAARRALDARDRVRARAAALDRRLFEDPDAEYGLARAVEHLRRTAEHGGDVAELALRAAIRRDEFP
ncbi:phosphate signaling complex PhoU family protein [Halorarum salinum]|uniref:Phosphate uptake regulator PhoU n=1 Tax=Halorarum salinum TaxID=2743089 RepID=A0A7D5L8D2_9EURY|nr:phosphate uptake regulator PhoU [Halobaculum salinum]QLG60411.1 phosphate uptake regulator PhoU [Halobaculum salinum]